MGTDIAGPSRPSDLTSTCRTGWNPIPTATAHCTALQPGCLPGHIPLFSSSRGSSALAPFGTRCTSPSSTVAWHLESSNPRFSNSTGHPSPRTTQHHILCRDCAAFIPACTWIVLYIRPYYSEQNIITLAFSLLFSVSGEATRSLGTGPFVYHRVRDIKKKEGLNFR